MNIFMVAGDISGDMHAANLAAAIKRIAPDTRIGALGGENLKAAADDFLGDLTALGAFGFSEPFRQYFALRRLFNDIILPAWNAQAPARVVLVDYYGFNIHVAEAASRRGIPVYYYVSPQVWASRPGRIRRLARAVRKMLVILPFEEALYRNAGVDATFVGHPLIDRVPPPMPSATIPAPPLIGLFPGSRPSVVKRHLPLLREAAELIGREVPARFSLFLPRATASFFPDLPFPLVAENGYEARKGLSLAISTSGTVSLENALLGIPMVVFYRLSAFNYAVAKLVANVNFITMVNIMAEREVVTELVQSEASPANIAHHALALLKNRSDYTRVRNELLAFRGRLGTPGVNERAARIILGQE